ncbi:HNH endonuclease [Mesorhizobium newzealandense]|uniref:HNH endonuclease n=1 Tax=Mesorhizobium newzealandense TaxID=1300302 RepID=A0ABW4UKA3_9HYPH
MKKLNHKSVKKVRSELSVIQGGICCYCKRPFEETGPRRVTLEHKTAQMYGGTNERSNLAAACHGCNHNRGRQMNAAKQRKEAGTRR